MHADSNPVPSSFIEFVEGWLLVQLRPAQRVLCKVCFDGWEPRDLVGEERAIARELFGDVDEIPAIARSAVAVLIGRGSGKSYLFALRVLHIGLTNPLSSLAPGEPGTGLIIGPSLAHAVHTLKFCSGAVGSNDVLRSMIRANTIESMALERWDGEVIEITARAASRGGASGRGASLFAVLMDEACFFRDDKSFVINDEDIYQAAIPRLLKGGQMLLPSTPWTESGLLWKMWKANLGNPQFAIAASAPTLLMRPEMADTVNNERLRDPDNARREYDAEPIGADAVYFFDPVALAACIDETMPSIVPRSNVFERAWMGLDTAFRKNPTGGAVVRATGPKGRLLVTAECVEIAPPKGGRLVPSETVQALVARARFHHAESLIADQHYIETVREHSAGMQLIEAPTVPADAYIIARDAVAEGRVRISAQHAKLISQLREVMAKPTAGGNISIVSPNRGTSHGDVASAWVLAMWKAAQPGASALKGESASSSGARLVDERAAVGRLRPVDDSGRSDEGRPRKVWE